jgi:hypothetical protein
LSRQDKSAVSFCDSIWGPLPDRSAEEYRSRRARPPLGRGHANKLISTSCRLCADKYFKSIVTSSVVIPRKAHQEAAHAYAGSTRYTQCDLLIFLLSRRAGLRAKEIAALKWQMGTGAECELANAIDLTYEVALCHCDQVRGMVSGFGVYRRFVSQRTENSDYELGSTNFYGWR